LTKDELLEKALCCNRCGTCRGVVQDAVPDVAFSTQCPSGMTLFGAYEPSGLMYLARGIAQGDLKWNEDLAKILYSCTMCGYCDDFCQRGYRHTPTNIIREELRAIIPDALKPKAIKNLVATLSVPKTTKLDVLKKYGVADVAEQKAATVLFGDNTILFNAAKLDEIGFIIKKSGKKVGCFISQPLPPVSTALLNGGFRKELDAALAVIDARLQAAGVKTVIVYNPESLSVLKRFSRSNVEFISITRFCADMLKSKKIKIKKLKLGKVTFQDPCNLGRLSKEYAAPREIMQRLGLSVVEMWRTRDNSLCCGGGGGVNVNRPDLAKKYADNRWLEIKATGAQTLLTACVFCNANLRQGKSKNIAMMDITSVVAQALGYAGKEARS
jgi:Fe-S oxidoreductase